MADWRKKPKDQMTSLERATLASEQMYGRPEAEEVEQPAPKPKPREPRAADALAGEGSVLDKIRKHRDAVDASADATYKRGGQVKSKKARGVGCAVRGHGKGKMR